MSFKSALILWYSLSVYVADVATILSLTGMQKVILLFSSLISITFIEATRSE